MVPHTPTHSKSRTLVGLVAFSLFVDYFLYGQVMPLMQQSPAKIGEEQFLGQHLVRIPAEPGFSRTRRRG